MRQIQKEKNKEKNTDRESIETGTQIDLKQTVTETDRQKNWQIDTEKYVRLKRIRKCLCVREGEIEKEERK